MNNLVMRQFIHLYQNLILTLYGGYSRAEKNSDPDRDDLVFPVFLPFTPCHLQAKAQKF